MRTGEASDRLDERRRLRGDLIAPRWRRCRRYFRSGNGCRRLGKKEEWPADASSEGVQGFSADAVDLEAEARWHPLRAVYRRSLLGLEEGFAEMVDSLEGMRREVAAVKACRATQLGPSGGAEIGVRELSARSRFLSSGSSFGCVQSLDTSLQCSTPRRILQAHEFGT